MIGQLLLKGSRIIGTGAFIEQRHCQRSDALPVGRILLDAAAKGEIERDQRQFVILDQPRLNAGFAGDFFNIGGVAWAGERRHCHQKRRIAAMKDILILSSYRSLSVGCAAALRGPKRSYRAAAGR